MLHSQKKGLTARFQNGIEQKDAKELGLLARVLIKGTIWTIDKGKWRELNGQKFFGFLEQSQATELRLKNNREGNIIKHISHVSFSQLKSLYLNHNGIASIEVMSTMQFPALKLLRIDNNQILEIKALRKAVFPSLEHIELDRNNIKQMVSLCESDLPNLEKLYVEYQNITGNKFIQDNSAEWIFKLKTKKIRKLTLENDERIKSENISMKSQSKFIYIS